MRDDSIRVLLVDDDPVDADLTQRALAQVGQPRFAIERAGSLSEAADRLQAMAFDVALLDLGVPDTVRAETVGKFRDICSRDLPIIVLTGLADENHALAALDDGAQDYLSKNDVTPDLMSRSIRYALQRHHLLGQLTAANELLEQKNRRLAQLYDTAQQFVENVSHEFRTPLTVIREFTSIIRDGLDGPVTPRQAEHLEKVLHRTDDLALMVDDMLDISKLEVGLLGAWRRPCQVMDLVETARSLVKARAESKRITLGMSVAAALPLVFCDEEKARRVIINLAVNAIKFTPEGGTVNIWSTAGDGDVTIGVSDTGPGISQENLAVIFERFRQVDPGLHTSTRGFGLGLNIAKELAALNLGCIHVESELGSGSTFSFTVPVYEPLVVFERYLDRVSSSGIARPTVSLLTAKIDMREWPSAVPVADEFLQRSVRANDLVMPCGNGTWAVAAVCPEQQGADLIQRLTVEWSNFVRNCPSTQLPALEITHCQARSVADERPQLVEAYRAIVGRRGAPHAQRTVLVVDDDREVSQCLGMRLRAAGYDVISAVDGEAGMSAALAHQPDAVVLDVRMPKKDGLTVLRELRNYPAMKSVPIVMLSASVRDQHRALEAGARYFVPKPYEASEILSAIESSLHEEIPT